MNAFNTLMDYIVLDTKTQNEGDLTEEEQQRSFNKRMCDLFNTEYFEETEPQEKTNGGT